MTKVEKKGDGKPIVPIDDLIKLHPDVEIEFFYNKQKLDHTSMFSEIQKDDSPEEKDLTKQSHLAQMMLAN